MPDLSVEIAGQTFKNPVLTASGTFGYGLEFLQYFDISCLGGFCTKGLSRRPRAGSPPGRIFETPSGMLNAIGLENVGVDAFVEEKLPRLREIDTRVVANVLGTSIDEFVEIAEILNPQPQVSALELNISCPNIRKGGIEFGHDPRLTFQVVEAVAKHSKKPVWVKLSPNVTDISVFARACQDGGADAVSLVNTLVGMSIDVHQRRPMLSNTVGGLSGPAIRPLAVRMVYQACQAVEIPVIGIGGISNTQDALEFLLAGATAIQVGTANFYDPLAAPKVIQGLEDHCRQEGVESVRELIGGMEEGEAREGTRKSREMVREKI